MRPLLTRHARLIRRAALFGLAYLAAFVVAGVAEAAGSREGGREEAIHAAGEQAASFLAVPAGGGDDGFDLPALPSRTIACAVVPAVAAGVPAHADLAPRIALRRRVSARDPPQRA